MRKLGLDANASRKTWTVSRYDRIKSDQERGASIVVDRTHFIYRGVQIPFSSFNVGRCTP